MVEHTHTHTRAQTHTHAHTRTHTQPHTQGLAGGGGTFLPDEPTTFLDHSTHAGHKTDDEFLGKSDGAAAPVQVTSRESREVGGTTERMDTDL